jgi:hypothetical protein
VVVGRRLPAGRDGRVEGLALTSRIAGEEDGRGPVSRLRVAVPELRAERLAEAFAGCPREEAREPVAHLRVAGQEERPDARHTPAEDVGAVGPVRVEKPQ